jgi:hypothetical protein
LATVAPEASAAFTEPGVGVGLVGGGGPANCACAVVGAIADITDMPSMKATATAGEIKRPPPVCPVRTSLDRQRINMIPVKRRSPAKICKQK